METIIVNLTPHKVTIVKEDGTLIQEFESEGVVRLMQNTMEVSTINNIPITKTFFGEPEGLPKEKPNVYYIVSRMVLEACKNREDLLVPNEIIRDDKGNIIGCKSLANN